VLPHRFHRRYHLLVRELCFQLTRTRAENRLR
jgi:hypothetical protein